MERVYIWVLLTTLISAHAHAQYQMNNHSTAVHNELKKQTSISRNMSSHIPDVCYQPVTYRNLLLGVFSGLVTVTGLVGNVMVIVVILLSPVLRKRNSHLFLLSLALADVGVSAMVTTTKVDMYHHNGNFCHGFGRCVFFQLTDTMFPITSLTHLLALCVDKWYAVTSPYDYVNVITRSKAKAAIVCIWIYAALWTALGTFKWEYPVVVFSYKIIQAGFGTFCHNYNRNYISTLIVFIYVIPMLILATLSIHMLFVVGAAQQPKSSLIQRTRKYSVSVSSKAIRTEGRVIAAYIVCWLPHIIVIVVQYWWPRVFISFSDTCPMVYDIVTTIISNILPTLNSCINPLIYCVFSKHFRIELSDLIRRQLGLPRYWSSQYTNTEDISKKLKCALAGMNGATSIFLPTIAFSALVILYFTSGKFLQARQQPFHRHVSSTSSLQDINRISMYAGDPDNDQLKVFPEVWTPVDAEGKV